MINIVFAEISAIKDVDEYLSKLPIIEHERINTFRRIEDKKRRLLALLLLQHCLVRTGFEKSLVNRITRSEFGKPSISSWYRYNISHSGKLVILAYSNECIGIDVEEVRPINDLNSFSWIFSAEENHELKISENKDYCFYKLWTKKECLLKAVGTGLVNNLSEIDCIGNRRRLNGQEWWFKQINFCDQYICHTCSILNEEPECIAVSF